MNTQTRPMQDKDLLNSVLTFEKHMANEYAIAVTESSCQVVRQMFTSLLDDTLQTQNDVFRTMSQQGWYQAPSKALKQDVDKQVQMYRQTEQQLQQLVQQHSSVSSHPETMPHGYGAQDQARYQHAAELNMNRQ